MKRLYVAFALITISIAICVYSSIKVENYATEMKEQLYLVGTEIKKEKHGSADRLLDKAKEKWDETETLYSFIVDADKIEEMSISFIMIEKLLGDGSTEHALERLHECELMLGEIAENEKLNIKNVM